MIRLFTLLCGAVSLAACQPDGGPVAPTPTAAESSEAYDGIAPGETVHFTGTEPFWGGEVAGETLTYTTPEDPKGTRITVERFAGRGGLSYSGSINGAAFEMTVTPLACSDGMSDRRYPFTVTLKVGDDLRNGCGWTDRQPVQP